MHLTKSKIDGLKYDGEVGRRDVRWDDSMPGFGLRVYPSGRKAFVLSYRADGRKRLITPHTAMDHAEMGEPADQVTEAR